MVFNACRFPGKGHAHRIFGVFLYMRSVKLPFIPLMIYYFGGAFTAVLTLYLIIFSFFAGICCEKASCGRPEPLTTGSPIQNTT
ncbi:hypothetical protein AZH53_00095 [Methanomicrobiaceae archaeon CYW5]|nr:hypothetical protein [Methanovulcanius yangii]